MMLNYVMGYKPNTVSKIVKQTTSIVKQDQKTQKVKKNANNFHQIIQNMCKFQGWPLFQAMNW